MKTAISPQAYFGLKNTMAKSGGPKGMQVAPKTHVVNLRLEDLIGDKRVTAQNSNPKSPQSSSRERLSIN